MMLKPRLAFSMASLVTMLSASSEIPAMIITGVDDGNITNCLLEKPEVCTTLNQTNESVMALDIFDGNIFAGLRFGSLHKCQMDMMNSCEIIMNTNKNIEVLKIVKDSVYTVSESGVVWRCRLREPHVCKAYKNIHVGLNRFYSTPSVCSMTASNEIFYFALDTGELRACYIDKSEPCWTLFFNRTNSDAYDQKHAYGLAVSRKYLFVALLSGTIMRCDLQGKNLTCADFYKTKKAIYSLAAHGDYIYAGTTELWSYQRLYEVRRCHTESSVCEVVTSYKSNIFSIVITYRSKEMDQGFRGKDVECTWRSKTKCEPNVVYYNSERRSVFELFVEDDKIYNSNGDLFDTKNADVSHSGRRAIFVMDPTGRIYASNTHAMYQFQESSFLAGEPAAAAGELVVDRGVIKTITNCSAHYRPNLELMKQVISSLREKGYTKYLSVSDCGEMERQKHSSDAETCSCP